MASSLRGRDVLVGLIGLALVALLILIQPSLELLFVIVAIVLVGALFATALGLHWPRD